MSLLLLFLAFFAYMLLVAYLANRALDRLTQWLTGYRLVRYSYRIHIDRRRK